MVMWFKYNPETQTRLDWLERCLISGTYPGPLWARMGKGLIYFARRNFNRYRRFRAKRRGMGKYRDCDLVYAAGARCRCGAGLAYPHDVSLWGEWACSACLKGEVPVSQDHDAYPFACYDIKSDHQPSAYGRTTRPGVKRVIYGCFKDKYIHG